jgi:hypothetical protein
MKNTHHTEMNELLIGRDLSWGDDGGVFREDPIPYTVNIPSKRLRRTKCKKQIGKSK